MKFLRIALMIVLIGCPSIGSSREAQGQLDYIFPKIPPYRSFRPTPEFAVKVPLPTVPVNLNFYEVQPITVNKDYVRRLAAALDLRAKARHLHGGRWEVVETPKHPLLKRSLHVYEASGGFSYEFDSLFFAPMEQQPKLPSEQEAWQLAVGFLKKNGLLPADAHTDIEQVHFSKPTLIERSAKEKKTLKEILTNIEVRFDRVLGGYRTAGPGSKLYVSFGEGGRILGITRIWRDVKKAAQTLPSIQPAQAIQLLRQGAGVLDADVACVQADVTHIYLVYWMESLKAQQRVSLPVYRIEGKCVSAEEKILGDFEAYAPAVLNSPFGRIEGSPESLGKDDDADNNKD